MPKTLSSNGIFQEKPTNFSNFLYFLKVEKHKDKTAFLSLVLSDLDKIFIGTWVASKPFKFANRYYPLSVSGSRFVDASCSCLFSGQSVYSRPTNKLNFIIFQKYFIKNFFQLSPSHLVIFF